MNENIIRRRDAFRVSSGIVLGSLAPPSLRRVEAADLPASQASRTDKTYDPLRRFPRMMQNFLLPIVQECHDRSVEAKSSIENRQQADAYRRGVRQKVEQCFGPLPQRVPLNPRITGILDRGTYRIEKVIFDSRPDFPVTANFYVPTNLQAPVPGIVGTCGHSKEGKAQEAYQAFAQGLARLGYACLIFDPIGQGERLQFPNGNGGSRIGIGVREHLHGGNQQFLVGEQFVTWVLWDSMRAVDYLLTREEVDPDQIGVTGNSGGGTQTTWLCSMDRRLSMAAPSCFVTTMLRNAENELPVDTEQCPPLAMKLGLEHEDFLIAMAPEPIRILGKEKDFFDIRGSEEAIQRLQSFYSHYDAREEVSLTIGPTAHGFTIENREFMYEWFNRVTGVSDTSTEPELIIEKEEDLFCVPHGQICVATDDWSAARTIADFTGEKAMRLAATRPTLVGESLKTAVRSRLKIPELDREPPHSRVLRSGGSRDHVRKYTTAYAVQTEPNALAICYWLSDERHTSRLPLGTPGRIATLYVSHRGSDEEIRDHGWLREMIAADPQQPFVTCDVRGIGESEPNTCDQQPFAAYGADYFYAIHGLMLGRPYLGQKTLDVLRVIQWLQSRGYDSLHLVGSGDGATIATFAALFSPTVQKFTLHQPLQSYESIATDPKYDLPLSMMIPGVLEDFDLPQCRDSLASQSLTMETIQ